MSSSERGDETSGSRSDTDDESVSNPDTDDEQSVSEFTIPGTRDSSSSKRSIVDGSDSESGNDWEQDAFLELIDFEDLPRGFQSKLFIDSTVVQSIVKSLSSKIKRADRVGFSSEDFQETLHLAERLGMCFDSANMRILKRDREIQALRRKMERAIDQLESNTFQYTDMLFKLTEELAIFKHHMSEPLHLLIHKRVDEFRLAVATAFISVLPGAFPSRKLTNSFTGGVIWDYFLTCLVTHYHSHHTILRWQIRLEDSKEPGNRWIQTKSVFSAIRIDIKDTELGRNIRHELATQLKHFTTVMAMNLERSKRKPRDPRLALKFFLPLLIWSYNECKDWVAALDECSSGQQSESTNIRLSETEVNCSATQTKAVFQAGTARDARRQWKRELERAGGEGALSDIQQLIQKSMDILGADSADGVASSLKINRQLLRKYGDRSAILSRFNWIRKCLIILSDDLLLDMLLKNDGAMRRFTMKMDASQIGIIEASQTIGRFDNADYKDTDEENLDRSTHLFLKDIEHMEHLEALVPAEQNIDSLVLKTVNDLLHEYGPFYLTDYGILFALLDKLDPIPH